MQQIGVGIIGVGLMGTLFAKLASQLVNSKLVGVADINQRQAIQVGDSLGVPAYTNYHDLLRLPQVDAVVVSTPDSLHVEPALAAAKAGKHLLIEKPLATTAEGGRQIIDACKRAGVTLMVAHVLRFDPNYGEAFRTVRVGKLGEVVHINARRTTSIGDAERLAGRVTVTFYLGIHSVDVMQWIAGTPIVEVTARGVRKRMARFGLEDTVMVLMRFQNGAIGALENSWIRPQGTASRRVGASLLIAGTEGIVQIEPYQPGITLYRPDSVESFLPTYGFEQTAFGQITGVYRDEFAHFLECVSLGTPPVIAPEQALSAVIVCSAIERSLTEGITIHIDQENVFA